MTQDNIYQVLTIVGQGSSEEEARRNLNSQIPLNFSLLDENVEHNYIGDSYEVTIRGKSSDYAFTQAERDTPPGMVISKKAVKVEPGIRSVICGGYSEEQLRKYYTGTYTRFVSCEVITPGNPGVLGLGKKMGQYKVEFERDAEVAVEYRRVGHVKITARVMGEGVNVETAVEESLYNKVLVKDEPTGMLYNIRCWIDILEPSKQQGMFPVEVAASVVSEGLSIFLGYAYPECEDAFSKSLQIGMYHRLTANNTLDPVILEFSDIESISCWLYRDGEDSICYTESFSGDIHDGDSSDITVVYKNDAKQTKLQISIKADKARCEEDVHQTIALFNTLIKAYTRH